jgi:hypothetical protein
VSVPAAEERNKKNENSATKPVSNEVYGKVVTFLHLGPLADAFIQSDLQ